MSTATYKIVCFGDSTTDASFFPKETKYQESYRNLKVYSQILEEKLPSLLDKEVVIINSGISGDTTYDALKRFQTDVLDHQPDAVFIQFGANDQSIRQDLDKTEPNVSLENFNKNLLYFINALKKTDTKLIVMTPGMMLWTDAFISSYFKHPYIIQEPLGLNENLKKYAQLICKTALLEHIDLINVFDKQITYSRSHNMFDLLPDAIHPNTKGHAFIANIILSHFN